MICLVDERISTAAERSLLIRGFRVIRMPATKRLSPAVASHPDMLVFAHGNKIISSAEYCENAPWVFTDIREHSRDCEISFTDDVFHPEYPRDAIFNALTVGDRMFAKSDTLSHAVLEYAEMSGMRIIPVKQGYPACTVLAFGENAITADRGMARALEAEGICVSMIENGGISLFPHEYGFIGGASGVLGDTVYFIGDPMSHPSGDVICRAIEDGGYKFISLCGGELSDLGRIIFI